MQVDVTGRDNAVIGLVARLGTGVGLAGLSQLLVRARPWVTMKLPRSGCQRRLITSMFSLHTFTSPRTFALTVTQQYDSSH